MTKHRPIERDRLRDADQGTAPWRLWGPYLSERQWGTVREDYSPDGTAWDYLPHDHARSRAYRWGEDGLAGLTDAEQRLCLSVALWNGRDPILKERLFGLTNSQGNHGEDVKELYYFLDATPTHSYLRMLYKYPQAEYPYQGLLDENARRGSADLEYELLDTGIFDDDRYFDVEVEYAKADPTDLLLRISIVNRGPEAAVLHVVPQLWFRNTWSWGRDPRKPSLRSLGHDVIEAVHPTLGSYYLHLDDGAVLLFTENETNAARLFGAENSSPYVKDAFHERIVHGNRGAVNPADIGTKAGRLAPGGRAGRRCGGAPDPAVGRAQGTGLARLRRGVRGPSARGRRVLRRGAGRDGRPGRDDGAAASLCRDDLVQAVLLPRRAPVAGRRSGPAPPPASRLHGRNSEWTHLNNYDILSMPDAWEYPWYAAWDLAFHCITFAVIDPAFAKDQLLRLTREWYMHPNGQLPAYEWAFGDVNPPVHAWAAYRVFQLDRKHRGGGRGDLAFLERIFHKLLINFTWWVNRKDAQGRNVFQGGFLGLDNIGVFDRNKPLPTGGFIDQADGTAWMAMYSLNLMRIALELAMHNRVYEDIATKFFEHFLSIAEAMTNLGGGGVGLWDPKDQFYYDVLNLPDDRLVPLKVRSMVGLIPLFAVETIDQAQLDALPEFAARLEWYLNYRPDLAALVGKWHVPGHGDRRLLSLVPGERIKPLLERMLDETEFLSDYGVRSLSRYHLDHPYQFRVDHQTLTVRYTPAESDSGVFGGNSNWRGPVWMPGNYLLIEALQKFHYYYHDLVAIECPTGSGRYLSLDEVAAELSRRLARLFLKDANGRRPVLAYHPKLAGDPHFRDLVLFHEYFHGDTGRGVGASHQTGWTGLIAKLLMPRTVTGLSKRAAADARSRAKDETSP